MASTNNINKNFNNNDFNKIVNVNENNTNNFRLSRDLKIALTENKMSP